MSSTLLLRGQIVPMPVTRPALLNDSSDWEFFSRTSLKGNYNATSRPRVDCPTAT